MELQQVALADLKPSPFNPRTFMDEAKFQELVKSVEGGLIEPIIGRPVNGKIEIVAGERRYRAAKKAKLATVPVIVKEMTDAAAMEAQLIENIQREDMNPLDEAAGFARLMKLDPEAYTADTLAAKIGLSKASVYLKLQLLNLIDPAKELLREGKIETAQGAALGRLSETDQKAALVWMKQQAGYNQEGRYPTIKALRDWVRDHVRLDLFGPEVAAAQPKVAEKLAKLKEKGIEPLQLSRTYTTQDVAGAKILGTQDYREVGKQKCDYAQPAAFVYGEEVQLAEVCTNRKQCKTHWKWEIENAKAMARHKARGKPAQQTPEAKKRQKAAEAKVKRERALYELMVAAAVSQAAAKAKKVSLDMVRRLIANSSSNSIYTDVFEPAYKSLGVPDKALRFSHQDIWNGAALKGVSEAQLAGLIVIDEAAAAGLDAPGSKYLSGFCSRHGLKLPALRKEAERQLAAQAEPEQAKLPAAKGKAKKKR